MSDEQDRERSFEELEAKYAESYQEMFDENSYMDEAEIDVLLSKEEKEAQARWQDLHALQQEYPDARDFLTDVLQALIGARPTDIQYDIMDFLQRGGDYRMIQAQRGEAKTTITGIYAVWRLIHDPTTRVLIFSAGGDMAEEISNWVIQVIYGLEILSCLRPDTTKMGQRASVKRFDVHYHLKGAEKSPSVACMGITANMQGRRADILAFKSRYQKCEGVCHSALVKIPPIAPRAPSEEFSQHVRRSKTALISAFSATGEASISPRSQLSR